MPRFLLVPSNNSLSHIAKALAIEEALRERGHEVCLAVGEGNRSFAAGCPRVAVLPDIQEADGSGFPTPAWFRAPEAVRTCLEAERALIRDFRPDRVLGVFRFTLPISAHLEGVACDSLVCASMLPESPEVLGFAPGEPGREEQKQLLDNFFRYAGSRLSRALDPLGLPPVEDIRQLLHGERTFLWDLPDFAPLPDLPQIRRVGPIPWQGWPASPLDLEALAAPSEPLAVLSFGTCVGSRETLLLLIPALRRLGYRVLVAAGGQRSLLENLVRDPGVTFCEMAPMHRVLPLTSLMACHGGQMTVFESLAQGVPVLVAPFQPEQAQSGVALERLGCGGRLVPPTLYGFSQTVYQRALEARGPEGLDRTIRGFLEASSLGTNLARVQTSLNQTRPIEDLCHGLES
ncbi:MAG: hypothetical protein H6Q00_1894 [Holophagaceae bacterium]|nr:hypothetical protein [Holophagaceae bacterium]